MPPQPYLYLAWHSRPAFTSPHPILQFHPFPSTHLCSIFWELASALYTIVHLKSSVAVLQIRSAEMPPPLGSLPGWLQLKGTLFLPRPPCPLHPVSSLVCLIFPHCLWAPEGGRDQTLRGKERITEGESCTARGSSSSHQPYSGCPALCLCSCCSHCRQDVPFSEILPICQGHSPTPHPP